MVLSTKQANRVALGEYMTVVDMTLDGRKTAYFEVLDRRGGVLGAIQWYGAWRQYCFFPDSDTAPVFNPDCLQRIAGFVAMCTRDHIARRSEKKQPDRQPAEGSGQQRG